jgi:DNA repair exonuclease SbcCD ATPase subunit
MPSTVPPAHSRPSVRNRVTNRTTAGTRGGAFRRRAATAVIATIIGAVALTGCAKLDDAIASDFQDSVQLVANYSAESDTTSALAELDALQQKLDAAIASGDVSDERATAIQTAIDRVRADIDGIAAQAAADQAAADAAAKAAAEAEAAAAAAEEKAAKEAAAAEEQATEDAREAAEDAAEEARQAAEDAAEEAKDAAEEIVENGPGNGNGNGKPGKEEKVKEE